jgi:DNA-binding CsgD family transcriptional regulator
VTAPSLNEPNTSLQPASPPDNGTLCTRTITGFFLIDEATGSSRKLSPGTTMIGRGTDLDLVVADPSVSRLHAEITVRGEYAFVTDLGLSTNGTRVNGRPVGRRRLRDGDVLTLGGASFRVVGPPDEVGSETMELRAIRAPDLTRRERDVLTALCRPSLHSDAFVNPASAREIAEELVVTEAEVKQHLLRLYAKFGIPEGGDRRVRLANEVVRAGFIRPAPPRPAGHAH